VIFEGGPSRGKRKRMTMSREMVTVEVNHKKGRLGQKEKERVMLSTDEAGERIATKEERRTKRSVPLGGKKGRFPPERSEFSV